MSDALFGRTLTLTGGEEFNGLKHWHAMCIEKTGGSIEIQVAEREVCFLMFPQCTKEDALQANLGLWLQLRPKYGSDLPDDHLRLMFRNNFPADVLADIRKHRDLGALQSKPRVYTMNWADALTPSCRNGTR